MKIEGVVFDLDATLVNLGGFVDWKKAHRMAEEVYLSCGCPEEMVRQFGKRGLFNMLNLMRDENALTMTGPEVERTQRRVYEVIEICEVEGIGKCHLMPGCTTVLEWLNAHRIRMGVATSNSQRVAEQILLSKGVERFFCAVVGRRPSLRMKPHPDQILRCFEEMGVRRDMGVVVGDSLQDVQAAKLAGISVIAVPSFFTDRDSLLESVVEMIINDLSELPEILSNLDPRLR